jgi:hypothetical protein
MDRDIVEIKGRGIKHSATFLYAAYKILLQPHSIVNIFITCAPIKHCITFIPIDLKRAPVTYPYSAWPRLPNSFA